MKVRLSNQSLLGIISIATFFLLILNLGCASTSQTTNTTQAQSGSEALVEHEPETLYENVPIVNRLVDIENNKSGFKINIWTVRNTDKYRIGEDVVYLIRTNRDSYVTLFNIGSSGNIYQIYPNQYQKVSFCRAGETVRIPASNADFAFQLQGPTGFETVKAFATLKDVPLLSPNLSQKVGPIHQATVPEKVLAREIITQLNNLPINYWAEDEYEIYVGY